MSTPLLSLSGRKKNDLHRHVANPPVAPNFAETGSANPHLRVFAVHFDGTQNDFADVPGDLQPTLVAHSYHELSGHANIKSHYYPGVGTRTDPFSGLIQSAFGVGCSDRAESAYWDLVKSAKAWIEEDPLAHVHVHVVGFSRGAATALHFMNLVDERGIPQDKQSADASAPHLLQPHSVPMSSVLLDTVATGQTDSLNLTLPDSAIAVLHITAGLELRSLFPLTSVEDPGHPSAEIDIETVAVSVDGQPSDLQQHRVVKLHEIMLDGACHSDVGGSYRDGGIRDISAYLMSSFQGSLGLPTSPRKPTFEYVQSVRAHDSRFFIDKLTPERPYRNGTRREIISRNPAPADDSAKLTVKLSSRSKSHHKKIDESFDLDFSLPDSVLGRKFSARIERMGPNEFSLSSQGDLGVTVDHGKRTIRLDGKELEGALSYLEVSKRLTESMPTLVINAFFERKHPLVRVVHQSFKKPGLTKLTQAKTSDPWPSAIRAAVMRLNDDRAPAGCKTTKAFLSQCVVDACLEVIEQSNGAITSIRLEAPRPTSGIGAGAAKVKVHIEPAPANGAQSDPVKALTAALTYLAMHTRNKHQFSLPLNPISLNQTPPSIDAGETNAPLPKRKKVQP